MNNITTKNLLKFGTKQIQKATSGINPFRCIKLPTFSSSPSKESNTDRRLGLQPQNRGVRVTHSDTLSRGEKFSNAKTTLNNIIRGEFQATSKTAQDISINSIHIPKMKDIAFKAEHTSHVDLGKIAKLAYFSPEQIKASQEKADGFSNKLEQNLKEAKNNKSSRRKVSTTTEEQLRKEQKTAEKLKNKAELVSEYYQDVKNNGTDLLADTYRDKNNENSNDPILRHGHALQNTVDSLDNGLQMVLLKNKKNNEVIIAFRGTDEKKDISTDLNLGKDQYNSIKDDLKQYISAIHEKSPDTKITFTGHSLGGGLSEIGGYFAKKENPKANISVVSFNGFGAESAIKDFENHKLSSVGAEGMCMDTVKALNSTHYRTKKDPVSPIGRHITNNNIQLNDGTSKRLESHQMNVINNFLEPSF